MKVIGPPPPVPGFKPKDVNFSSELRNFNNLIIVLCVFMFSRRSTKEATVELTELC